MKIDDALACAEHAYATDGPMHHAAIMLAAEVRSLKADITEQAAMLKRCEKTLSVVISDAVADDLDDWFLSAKETLAAITALNQS